MGGDGGLSSTDLVAIILAAASFLISLAALYATALKKAHIGMHYTPLDGEWHVGGGAA
jgi:hypothetical protein